MMFFPILAQLFKLLIFDAIVACIFLILLLVIKVFKCASYAVLKRDFVGYFSNPTGYVFICVFMLLGSCFAFWPDEFFNANLATLDQLNLHFPLIMLVFIPAITMSLWSEERREGTDELLLTIPASDVDIVLGKYLAAVSIFSVSLFFSQLTNAFVLLQLSEGEIDLGLFITTYIGYWFMGIAMLALGMAASFLTSNLTVSFILGALVNVPFVIMRYADTILPGQGIAQSISWWSYLSRFNDFGRGVISWASTSFFLLVAALGVYLSVILIGRRHWQGGRDGKSMLSHYVIRGLAMGVIALAASRFFSYHDWLRYDATSGKVSSLSPDTKKLLRNLKTDNTVLIDAFVSANVPEQYVQTKVDLVNMLREFESLAGANLEIRLNENMDTFTEEATRAEEQYGITAQTVMTQSRGSIKQEDLFMGAAFSCGLERVVIPFFDRGIPVEYELVRSVRTVANGIRLRVGIVKTDAEMFGGVDMSSFRQTPKQLIVQELEKQYEVEEVDLSTAIAEGRYDVLMVVQPSSLTPPAMQNLVTAIRNGQPTAIFEDPYPAMMGGVPATSQPRPPQGGQMAAMFGGGRPPEPKGDIRQLWDTLGIDMVSGAGAAGPDGLVDAQVIWQKFNPYAGKVNVSNITPEWVFINPDAPGVGNDAFNEQDNVTSKLTNLLFLYPGAIRDLGSRGLTFTPLVMTGDESGKVGFSELRQYQGSNEMMEYARTAGYTKKRYVIGARIRGKIRSEFQMSDAGSPLLAQAAGPEPPATGSGGDQSNATQSSDDQGAGASRSPSDSRDSESRKNEIHVVYISDIDLLSSEFLALRAQPDQEIGWDFDNVTFVLNILDSLAGSDDLIEVRKRKIRHSTLTMVSRQLDEARAKGLEQVSGFKEKFETAREEAQDAMEEKLKEIQDRLAELREKAPTGGAEIRNQYMQAKQQEALAVQREQMKFERQVVQLEQERDRELKSIEREMELQIRKVERNIKFAAAFFPPVLPLLVGLLVWLYRLSREKEGVSSARLR